MKKTTLSEYAQNYDNMNFMIKFLHKKVIPFLNFDEKDTVLDLGCGTAELPIFLSQRHKSKFIGIDYSKEMLFEAKKKKIPKNLKLIQADAKKLPLKDKSIDFAYSTIAMHHMPKKEALLELNRVLKKGKKVIIADMMDEGILGKLIRFIEEKMFLEVKILKNDDFVILMKNAGFKNVKITKIYKFFYVFEGQKQ